MSIRQSSKTKKVTDMGFVFIFSMPSLSSSHTFFALLTSHLDSLIDDLVFLTKKTKKKREEKQEVILSFLFEPDKGKKEKRRAMVNLSHLQFVH